MTLSYFEVGVVICKLAIKELEKKYNMSTMLNIFRKVLLVAKNNEVDYMFVFLSHNFKDKDIIEPIAVRIAGVYGKKMFL